MNCIWNETWSEKAFTSPETVMNAMLPLIVGMQEYHCHLGAVNTIMFIEEG
jgi:hypothetical protein